MPEDLGRFDVAGDGFREDAAVGFLAKDGNADFEVRAELLQHGDFVAPGDRPDIFLPTPFFPDIRQIDVEGLLGQASLSSPGRLLRKAAGGVLGRTLPCDVPQGYASVAVLPAALPDGLSEQPANNSSRWSHAAVSHDSLVEPPACAGDFSLLFPLGVTLG